MLEFTPLAATESVSPSGNGFIRVFYQSEDNCIREACYEDTHGWYSTDADVVVKAKKNTPIAAVSLDNGASRLFYYLDEDNKIRERLGDSGHLCGTTWKDGHTFGEKVLPESHIFEGKADRGTKVHNDGRRRIYRIACDNHTSGLWLSSDDMKAGEDPHIDDEVMVSRFPGFAHHFRPWIQKYEMQYREHILGSGSSDDLFQKKEDLLAFDVEGFFLGWRLALEDTVGNVEYYSVATKQEYNLEEGNEMGLFKKYFADLRAIGLLPSRLVDVYL